MGKKKKSKKGKTALIVPSRRPRKLTHQIDSDFSDIPLVGSLLRGIGKFIDFAERAEKAGGEIRRQGEIKGKEGIKGVYRFLIRTGLEPPKKNEHRRKSFKNYKK